MVVVLAVVPSLFRGMNRALRLIVLKFPVAQSTQLFCDLAPCRSLAGIHMADYVRTNALPIEAIHDEMMPSIPYTVSGNQLVNPGSVADRNIEGLFSWFSQWAG